MGDRGLERVEDAGVLVLAGQAFQAGIEFVGIVLCELRHRADAEQVEIALDCWANGDEVLQAA